MPHVGAVFGRRRRAQPRGTEQAHQDVIHSTSRTPHAAADAAPPVIEGGFGKAPALSPFPHQ